MAARKNKKFLLSKTETEDFLAFLKENKINLKDAAHDYCVTYQTFHRCVVELIVPKSWRELTELKLENKKLKEKINQISKAFEK